MGLNVIQAKLNTKQCWSAVSHTVGMRGGRGFPQGVLWFTARAEVKSFFVAPPSFQAHSPRTHLLLMSLTVDSCRLSQKTHFDDSFDISGHSYPKLQPNYPKHIIYSFPLEKCLSLPRAEIIIQRQFLDSKTRQPTSFSFLLFNYFLFHCFWRFPFLP